MPFTYKEEKNKNATQRVDEMLEYMPKFCTSYVHARERSVSPLTLLAYMQRINIFFRYLHNDNSYFRNKPISEITLDDMSLLKTDDIEDFTHWIFKQQVDDPNHSNKSSTVDNYLSALNSFWSYFCRTEKLSYNPVANVERGNKQPHEVIRLNNQQADGFIESIVDGKGLTKRQKQSHDKNQNVIVRDRAICMLFLDTGLRVSELVGLNVNDVSLDQKCVRVLRKRSKVDDVYMSDTVTEILKDYIVNYRNTFHPVDNEEALFLVGIGKYKGERLGVRSVQKMVKKYAKAGAGIVGPSITPHKLRATYATNALRATNGNLEYVRETMAHSSANTTLLYTQTSELDKQKFRGVIFDGPDSDLVNREKALEDALELLKKEKKFN